MLKEDNKNVLSRFYSAAKKNNATNIMHLPQIVL